MVELEQRPVEPLTFTNRGKTAGVPHKDTYNANDIISTLALLEIKQQSTKTYELIHKLAPNSRISTPHDRRVRHSLTQEDLTKIIEHSIQNHESRKTENVRHYVIDITNEIVIELRGITDYKWKIYEPLLDALSTTRRQTESGEIQKSPITYQEVKSFFPESTPDSPIIYDNFKKLNIALAPSGWSVIRKGKGPKKPTDAPWFLRGPDDNGHQDKRHPELPKKENVFDRSVFEERRKSVKKRFDRLAFGTRLLHCSLSNLANPEAKKIFTKDLEQFMSSCLPADLKLYDIKGDKTLQGWFEELIRDAVNSMAGKQYQDLPEIQQTILPMWNQLKKQSGQHPKTVIFEHFSEHDSNKPLDQGNNDTGNSEEDILKPKPTRGRPFTSVRVRKFPKDTVHS